MNQQRAQQKEQVMRDIKTVMSELDELARESASDVGDEVRELKGKLRERVGTARESLADLEGRVVDRAKAAAQVGDEYVREHTWTSVGIAAAVGVVVGLLLNRR